MRSFRGIGLLAAASLAVIGAGPTAMPDEKDFFSTRGVDGPPLRSKGKRQANRKRKPNRLIVSKRVRRKHRRAR